jgi:hypothetical protein
LFAVVGNSQPLGDLRLYLYPVFELSIVAATVVTDEVLSNVYVDREPDNDIVEDAVILSRFEVL